MNWFTSDTHFGHKTVIQYCDRPFRNVVEMNEELIRRWNAVVKETDTVYHLGDFSFLGSMRTKEIVASLNGRKILIRGNHDSKPHRFFERVEDWIIMEIGGAQVLLSHYPFLGQQMDDRDFSDRQLRFDGRWLLHGHVHTAWKVKDRMINVGVDQWAYAPVSEDEIYEILKGKS